MRKALLTIFAFLLWVAPARALTMTEAFEAAWSRSTAEGTHDDKTKSLDDAIDVASSLTPAPPAIIGEYRHELLYGLRRNVMSPDGGSSSETSVDGNDFKIGLSIPLWLPSQRGKSIAAARAEKRAYLADYGAAKLELAGELRSLVAELRAAEIEIRVAETTLQDSYAIVEDVKKRFKVGDLAKNDLDKAVSDHKSAQADLLRAKQKLRKPMALYEVLVGVSKIPNEPEKKVEPSLIENHPRLLKAKADLEAAKAKEKKAGAEFMDTPELGVQYGTLLNSRLKPADQAIIVNFKIPLPSPSRYNAKNSEARSARVKAAVVVQREWDSLKANIEAVAHSLTAAEEERAAMQASFESASAVHVATLRAFELGEGDLASLLKSANDKRRTLLRFEASKLAVDVAVSDYNQSMGVLP